ATAQDASAWLERGRAMVLRGDIAGANVAFRHGLLADPASIELRHALAGVLWQGGDAAQAESLLRTPLAEDPGNVAAGFLLARLLKAQGRMLAVETCTRALFAQ